MKHVVVVHRDLGGQGQTAGLANDDIPADFPMSAILTFANQKVDLFFRTHLESPEFLFDFTNEVGEWRCGYNTRLPAQIPLDQVVLLNDARAGKLVSTAIRIAAHQPEVVGDRACGCDIVGNHNDRVQIVHVGDLGDQLAGLLQHEQVKAGKRLVHQQEVFAAEDLLDNGAPLALAAR
jgi:hypothetical protein